MQMTVGGMSWVIGVGRETVSSFLLTVQGQDVTQVERSHGSESLTPLSWSFPGSGSHRGGGAISRAGHLEIRRYKEGVVVGHHAVDMGLRG